MKVNPQSFEEKIKEAQKLYLDHQYEKALEKYLQIEQELPSEDENLPVVQLEIGWTYYAMKDYRQAIPYLEKGITSLPEDKYPRELFDCLQMLGFASEGIHDYSSAMKWFQKALQLPVEEKAKAMLSFHLGKLLFSLTKYDEAKKYLEPLLKGKPALLDSSFLQTIRYFLGFIAISEDDYSRAMTYFQEYISHAPDEKNKAPGYYGLAFIHNARKEFTAVVDACKKVIQLDPEFFDKESIAYFLCMAYMQLEMWEELDMFFRELQNNYPEGRYAEVYPIFEKALKERKVPGKKEKASKGKSELFSSDEDESHKD